VSTSVDDYTVAGITLNTHFETSRKS